MFCRETVADLRAIAEADPSFLPVLFVHMGSPDEGRAFFDRLWPEARAIADPGQALYDAFSRPRGSLGQLVGPSVWKAGIKSFARGFGVGKPVGDPRVMPGAFVVEGSRMIWQHEFTHAGDHPDWKAVPGYLA